jgi:hypothetical protein
MNSQVFAGKAEATLNSLATVQLLYLVSEKTSLFPKGVKYTALWLWPRIKKNDIEVIYL